MAEFQSKSTDIKEGFSILGCGSVKIILKPSTPDSSPTSYLLTPTPQLLRISEVLAAAELSGGKGGERMDLRFRV